MAIWGKLFRRKQVLLRNKSRVSRGDVGYAEIRGLRRGQMKFVLIGHGKDVRLYAKRSGEPWYCFKQGNDRIRTHFSKML